MERSAKETNTRKVRGMEAVVVPGLNALRRVVYRRMLTAFDNYEGLLCKGSCFR